MVPDVPSVERIVQQFNVNKLVQIVQAVQPLRSFKSFIRSEPVPIVSIVPIVPGGQRAPQHIHGGRHNTHYNLLESGVIIEVKLRFSASLNSRVRSQFLAIVSFPVRERG